MYTKKNINCTICLDVIESEPYFLPCVHGFHHDCIRNWIKEKPVCPICKIPIYVNTPEKLEIYNYNQRLKEQQEIDESRFFQQLSSGDLNNVQQPAPTPTLLPLPHGSEIFEITPLMGIIRRPTNNSENTESGINNLCSVLQLFDQIINNISGIDNNELESNYVGNNIDYTIEISDRISNLNTDEDVNNE